MKKQTKIAAGVITAAIIACAVYFLTGERGKKNREKIKNVANEMKKELLERMKDIKELTEEEYLKLVDEISNKYTRLKKVSQRELSNIISTMKDAWKHIQKEINK
ncbi:MAG: YtxH domain-containing protein [Elusimicrobiales bacterium]|nr:YtxH domain-containing protein [Elusimicrobiales bacterium]